MGGKMKKSMKSAAAVLSAAVISVCSSASMFALAADTEEQHEVTIKFDITEDMTPSKTTDTSLFETKTYTEKNITIPAGYFSKSGVTFSGWTVDGVIGYTAGTYFAIPQDVDEVVFKPCWVNTKAAPHTVTYNFEYEGEELEKPDYFEDVKYSANEIFSPEYAMLQYENVASRGLTDGERVFELGEKIVMPDHDLVLYPVFFKRINLTYYAGDVDRLNGNTSFTYKRNEGSSDELAAKDRFSRDGFTLTGWKSSIDGKVYSTGQTVVFPSEDVTFTAVWTPDEYNVVFIPGNGGTSIKVPGVTDSEIVCPEPGITVSGKYFAGWKDSGGKLYQAGEKYMIRGAKPGLGISLKAVWNDGEAPTTQPAVDIKPMLGDVNGDENVTVADAVAILQFIGNRDKYQLSEQAKKNADVDGVEGLTPNDALTIQKLDAKIIDKFPAAE